MKITPADKFFIGIIITFIVTVIAIGITIVTTKQTGSSPLYALLIAVIGGVVLFILGIINLCFRIVR